MKPVSRVGRIFFRGERERERERERTLVGPNCSRPGTFCRPVEGREQARALPVIRTLQLFGRYITAGMRREYAQKKAGGRNATHRRSTVR